MASHHGLQMAPDGNDKGKEMFSVRRLSGVRTTSLQYGRKCTAIKTSTLIVPLTVYFRSVSEKVPLLRLKGSSDQSHFILKSMSERVGSDIERL